METHYALLSFSNINLSLVDGQVSLVSLSYAVCISLNFMRQPLYIFELGHLLVFSFRKSPFGLVMSGLVTLLPLVISD